MEPLNETKEKRYTDFYQRLRMKINRWSKGGKLENKRGTWTDRFLQYLLILPDLVYLIIRLLLDRETPRRIKGLIIVALSYLVFPIDIIPDFIPVLGFIDDLLVIVIVLNKIINSAEPKVLDRLNALWAGEEDVIVKVKEITATMNDMSANIPKALYNFMKEEDIETSTPGSPKKKATGKK